jgi:DNA-binding response OmpR family regulator
MGPPVWRMAVKGGLDRIVLDAMLPGKSGPDVCRELRQQEGRRPHGMAFGVNL